MNYINCTVIAALLGLITALPVQADSLSILSFCIHGSGDDDSIDIGERARVECSIHGNGKIKLKRESVLYGSIYSRDEVKIGKFADIVNFIHADDNVEIGDNSSIGSDIVSGDTVKIKKAVSVAGSITAAGTIEIGNGTNVSGVADENAVVELVPSVFLEQLSTKSGLDDIEVNSDDSLVLLPGAYGKIKVKKYGQLVLSSGHYQFEKLVTEKNTSVILNAVSDSILVKVKNKIEIGEESTISMGAGDASNVVFFSESHDIKFKKDGNHAGTFVTPTGKIEVGDRTTITGALYGNKVKLKKDTSLYFVPATVAFAELYGDNIVTNTRPTANAGNDFLSEVGVPTEIIGIGTDEDNDLLSYAWSLISKPDSSTLDVLPANQPILSFIPDVEGVYTFKFIVNDGVLQSLPATVTITINPAQTGGPVANAGDDVLTRLDATQDVAMMAVVTLDGTDSYLPPGENVTISWSLDITTSADRTPRNTYGYSCPGFTTGNCGTLTPTFNIYAVGTVIAELTISSDSGVSKSTVNIYIPWQQNQRPVAIIDGFSTVPIGEQIVLDGSNSYDPDVNDVIDYEWSLGYSTDEANIDLLNENSATPSVIIYVPGVYSINLRTTDAYDRSELASISLTAIDIVERPVAIIRSRSGNGPDYFSSTSGYLGTEYSLDGSTSLGLSASSTLEYSWTLLSKPTKSSLVLHTASSSVQTVQPDVPGAYEYQLRVLENGKQSEPVTLTINIYNRRPVADSGDDFQVLVGQSISLDGSASTDPDGQPLTYEWFVSSRPSGSSFTIQNRTSQVTSYLAEIEGRYVFSLRVRDDSGGFDESKVTVTVEPDPDANSSPVALISEPLILNGTIYLDASESIDADGDTLSFQWRIVSQPANSLAILAEGNSENATLIADVHGLYEFELVVTDGVDNSLPDTLSVEILESDIGNTVPIALAGGDVMGEVGSHIALIASGSTDADGDTLYFQWRIVSQPADSLSVLTESDNEFASLIPDVKGLYEIELIVSDGVAFSQPDTLIVDVLETDAGNTAPVPSAGYDQKLVVGTEVWLQWGLTYDPDPADVLEFSWNVDSKPIGSSASINSYSSGEVTIDLDAPGEYIVTLTVSDGKAVATDSVVITAVLTTIDLPADPGPFSDNNLFGYDANQNGVRDDVERFISANYRSDPNLERSLYQLAASIRTMFSYLGVERLIGETLTLVNNAYECYYFVSDDGIEASAVDYVIAEMVNNEARLNAFLEFGATINGHIFVGNPIEQWSDSCSFEVQP